jgi:two-component system, sensor histidine kinase PdtaS
VASLAELARAHTDLDVPAVAHLQRLVGSWGLLSDFCFADLLLYAPSTGFDGDEFVVVGQIRPATSQTVHRRDWVGQTIAADDRSIVARAYRLGEIIEGEAELSSLKERVRMLAIPVRCGGGVIGVLTRETMPSFGRQAGDLERIYVEIFNRFARMISAGVFPFDGPDAEPEEAPRVGDGVMLLDVQRRVVYSSPNAVSALHRLGMHANTEGMRLGELGIDESSIRASYARPGPVTAELEHGPEVSVLMRSIPLVEMGEVSGAVLLLRDISELRRRDRLLMSKDATIQEIHHRVKNNLQTISSLLRLQGRRLESKEAKAAIEESVRRVRSIALVHEILSREAGEEVPFIEIVKPLCRMVEEAFHSPDRPVRCKVDGDAGDLPAQVATPLAVVLNELLQNAFDHAYPEGSGGGDVRLVLRRNGDELHVEVIDDGQGVPEGFELAGSTGLGLSIVRTLVTSEMQGSIQLRNNDAAAAGHGTVVTLLVPVRPSHT